MKTEYKKVSELLALEDAEVLKEFEMIELQGGMEVSPKSTNLSCTNTNTNCDCSVIKCVLVEQNCFTPPPFTLRFCSVFAC